MTTLATLVARIADEFSRTDLDTQIERFVLDAVKRYKSYGWWFNQSVATITTTADDYQYAVPDDFLAVDSLTVTSGTDVWPLTECPYAQIAALETDTTGEPTMFALYRQQFRLYPVPDGEYTLTLSYLVILDALTSTDSNAWTTNVEELIRCAASEALCRGLLRDPTWADQWRVMKNDAFRDFRRESAMRTTTGTLAGSGF